MSFERHMQNKKISLFKANKQSLPKELLPFPKTFQIQHYSSPPTTKLPSNNADTCDPAYRLIENNLHPVQADASQLMNDVSLISVHKLRGQLSQPHTRRNALVSLESLPDKLTQALRQEIARCLLDSDLTTRSLSANLLLKKNKVQDQLTFRRVMDTNPPSDSSVVLALLGILVKYPKACSEFLLKDSMLILKSLPLSPPLYETTVRRLLHEGLTLQKANFDNQEFLCLNGQLYLLHPLSEQWDGLQRASLYVANCANPIAFQRVRTLAGHLIKSYKIGCQIPGSVQQPVFTLETGVLLGCMSQWNPPDQTWRKRMCALGPGRLAQYEDRLEVPQTLIWEWPYVGCKTVELFLYKTYERIEEEGLYSYVDRTMSIGSQLQLTKQQVGQLLQAFIAGFGNQAFVLLFFHLFRLSPPNRKLIAAQIFCRYATLVSYSIRKESVKQVFEARECEQQLREALQCLEGVQKERSVFREWLQSELKV